jgi:hypothetical protein
VGVGGDVACVAWLAVGSGRPVAAVVGLGSTATACAPLGGAVVLGDGACTASDGEGEPERWPASPTAARPTTSASADAAATKAAVLRTLRDRSVGRSPHGRVQESLQEGGGAGGR